MATATYTQTLQTEGAESGDVGDVITHCAVHATSAADDCLATFDLTSMLAGIAAGQPVQFQPNQLVMQITATAVSATYDRLTAAGALAAIRGLFSVDRYLTWHTGDPGDDGDTNKVDGIDPTLLPVANLTFAE